jgi:HEPN domain-containing protein
VSIARSIRDAIQTLRRMGDDWPPARHDVKDVATDLSEALEEPERAVELGVCIGSECIDIHGLRVATWEGIGPCCRYIVCDECHSTRLTEEERKHMVEVFNAAWIRHLGLHALHNGREVDS